MNIQTLRICDLTKLDALELEQRLKGEDVQIDVPKEAQDLHGELATATALVVVTLSALKVLAAYLLKDRERGTLTRRIEVTARDGTKRLETVTLSVDSSKAPDKEVLKQLAKLCDVDLETLASQ